MDFSACVPRRERDLSCWDLSGSNSIVGRFDAVIDGIADEMDERIVQLFDDGLIELGVLALHDQFDLLAEIA